MQAAPHCCFDDTVEAGIGGVRHHAQHVIERFAGEVGETRGEVRLLKKREGALQCLLMADRKRAANKCPDYRRRIGRNPLSVATIAEPLLISAVVVGLIRPPGRASARASVLRPATIA